MYGDTTRVSLKKSCITVHFFRRTRLCTLVSAIIVPLDAPRSLRITINCVLQAEVCNNNTYMFRRLFSTGQVSRSVCRISFFPRRSTFFERFAILRTPAKKQERLHLRRYTFAPRRLIDLFSCEMIGARLPLRAVQYY